MLIVHCATSLDWAEGKLGLQAPHSSSSQSYKFSLTSQVDIQKQLKNELLNGPKVTSQTFAATCACNVTTVQRRGSYALDTVQDFLIKLGIKPCIHSYIGNKHFFTKSCHSQTYQNYEQAHQRLQNLYFQSHFSASKINGMFLIFLLWKILDQKISLHK